jgi:hypothetical protein
MALRVSPHSDAVSPPLVSLNIKPLPEWRWENDQTPKGKIMKTYKHVALALMSAFALSILTTACDREVSHTESEKVKGDGTVEKKEKTTTESPDGTV